MCLTLNHMDVIPSITVGLNIPNEKVTIRHVRGAHSGVAVVGSALFGDATSLVSRRWMSDRLS
jgi:hypothetical protein